MSNTGDSIIRVSMVKNITQRVTGFVRLPRHASGIVCLKACGSAKEAEREIPSTGSFPIFASISELSIST